MLSIFISSLRIDRKYFNWFNQNSMHFRFEIAIFILIFLNMVTMGIEHYNQSRAFTFTLEITNALFVTIFALGKLFGHLILTEYISKLKMSNMLCNANIQYFLYTNRMRCKNNWIATTILYCWLECFWLCIGHCFCCWNCYGRYDGKLSGISNSAKSCKSF